MTVLTESQRLGDVLKYEAPNLYSREEMIVVKGQTLALGTVVGRQSKDIVTIKAKDGNTGDGTIGDVSLGALAQIGLYTATAEQNDNFSLIAPDGSLLPAIKVGTPYKTNHLQLTLTAGDTEFAQGDAFTIEIAGSNKVAALMPDAVDGRQTPIGIVMTDVHAEDVDAKTVIIVRHALLSDQGLIWPETITDTQKKSAVTQLEVHGLVIRKGV